MKKLLLLLLLSPGFLLAQDCSCEANFLWLKKTFEENDAGFQYALNRKGTAEYEKHTALYAEKVKSITSPTACSATLMEWLLFFRKAHLSISLKDNTATTAVASNSQIPWKTYEITDKKLKKQLENAGEKGFEGIWKTDPYTIGILKTGTGYVGFIIAAPGTNWQKNQIKLILKPNAAHGTYDGEFYMRNYATQHFENAELIGKNILNLGPFMLKRVNPKQEDSPEIQLYSELLTANQPMIKEVNKNTLLLRIPSFASSNKKAIDSLLKTYHNQITNTENLIIDIRGNGGGSDGSYNKIIPYLYTNPIRIVGLELYSTPLNNQRMEGFLSEPGITEAEKKEIQKDLAMLNANLGKFVNLSGDNIVYTQKMDNVYAYPKNVAVLIDENNGSTAEQFLLAAKQSRKVKLFGTTTFGVLDISNMHFVDSPCTTLTLGYSLSKSFRIPDMTIDDKGIQPDFYMDKSIPKQDWVPFVVKILNND